MYQRIFAQRMLISKGKVVLHVHFVCWFIFVQETNYVVDVDTPFEVGIVADA